MNHAVHYRPEQDVGEEASKEVVSPQFQLRAEVLAPAGTHVEPDHTLGNKQIIKK